MNALEQKLLNDFQRDFPLSPEPFSDIAAQLGSDPRTVLSTLRALSEAGVLSRVGPVFRPNAIGASTLAAMAIPAHDLERVAAIVSGHAEVNHNYEREHRFNLWFVATHESRAALARTLESIERETGYPLLSLPMLREYHIDLGFHLHRARGVRRHSTGSDEIHTGAQSGDVTASDEKLIEAIQLGLPLVEHPYRAVGARVGISEQAVLKGIRSMQSSGAIKRFGVVVRHHKLGYRANAMVVWDVADDRVDALGRELGRIECVTLCYQRPRRLPEWRYNLFCMIHGKDREEVLRCIGDLESSLDLQEIPHEVLFSKRQFKQRGARYRGNSGKPSMMGALDRRIINHLQGGFPLSDRPYLEVAGQLGTTEAEVVKRLQKMLDTGVLSRFGPMYHAEKMGGGLSLCAMSAPRESFDEIAEKVNAFPQVAHNYARDHKFNMWFVLATESPDEIPALIRKIEQVTGFRVYDMPKLDEYFIGLRLEA